MITFSVPIKRSYLYLTMIFVLAVASLLCIFLLSMPDWLQLFLACLVFVFVWRARPKLRAIEWSQKSGWFFCYADRRIPIKLKPVMANRFFVLINGELIFKDALEPEPMRQLIKKILSSSRVSEN